MSDWNEKQKLPQELIANIQTIIELLLNELEKLQNRVDELEKQSIIGWEFWDNPEDDAYNTYKDDQDAKAN